MPGLNKLKIKMPKENDESRVLTCVYCGHEYPQGTPAAGSKVLTDHIKICEKHPLRAAEAENAKLREIVRLLFHKDLNYDTVLDPELLRKRREIIQQGFVELTHRGAAMAIKAITLYIEVLETDEKNKEANI